MVRIARMGQAVHMQLPGPLRAAVGIVANAADEARHLPDRAIELPMLAVSTALQMSLRAQQRYARLTARGDAVLNRRRATDEPPPWATFDEPIPADDLRGAALNNVKSIGHAPSAADFLDQVFGNVDEPRRPAAKRSPAKTPPAQKATAPKAPAKNAPVKKAPAKKAPGKAAVNNAPGKAAVSNAPAKATAKTTPAKAAARATPPRAAARAPAKKLGKTVNKPRHTAPSRFDDAEG
jgi:hypothetical protein